MCCKFCGKDLQARSYSSVALFFILVGVGVFTYGGVEWLVNSLSASEWFYFPGFKVATGLVIMALGYIVLELELMRTKK